VNYRRNGIILRWKKYSSKKIYKELEKKHATWDKVIEAIDDAFKPFKKQLKRDISREDIIKLTEKPVRRIYRLDIDELNDQIKGLEADIKQVKHDLANLVDYAVAYFENLLKKYGKGRERKTEIKSIEVIEARHVAIVNTKVYMNREDGFIGTGLKKDEFVCDCSDIDDLIVFTKQGKMKVVKVSEKSYIGKDIIHAAVFKKNDERTTYNMIYADGKGGKSFAKRFNVTGVTRDKEYDLTKGDEKSKVHYLTINANGEAELVKIALSPTCAAHKKEIDFNFAELEIKGRSSMGNTVTKYPIKSVRMKEAGVSTIAGKKLWYDNQFGRLNTEEKGDFIGTYEQDDNILVVMNDGNYMITDQEVSQKLDADKVILIEKFNPEKIITAVYADIDKKQYMVKRFKIETTTLRNKFMFIKEGDGNYVEAVCTDEEPVLSVQQGRGAQVRKGKLKITKIAELSGWKTVGTRLLDYSKSVEMEWVKDGKSNQQELF
jgi:topoisomerase IV subunit A